MLVLVLPWWSRAVECILCPCSPPETERSGGVLCAAGVKRGAGLGEGCLGPPLLGARVCPNAPLPARPKPAGGLRGEGRTSLKAGSLLRKHARGWAGRGRAATGGGLAPARHEMASSDPRSPEAFATSARSSAPAAPPRSFCRRRPSRLPARLCPPHRPGNRAAVGYPRCGPVPRCSAGRAGERRRPVPRGRVSPPEHRRRRAEPRPRAAAGPPRCGRGVGPVPVRRPAGPCEAPGEGAPRGGTGFPASRPPQAASDGAGAGGQRWGRGGGGGGAALGPGGPWGGPASPRPGPALRRHRACAAAEPGPPASPTRRERRGGVGRKRAPPPRGRGVGGPTLPYPEVRW